MCKSPLLKKQKPTSLIQPPVCHHPAFSHHGTCALSSAPGVSTAGRSGAGPARGLYPHFSVETAHESQDIPGNLNHIFSGLVCSPFCIPEVPGHQLLIIPSLAPLPLPSPQTIFSSKICCWSLPFSHYTFLVIPVNLLFQTPQERVQCLQDTDAQSPMSPLRGLL